MYVYIKLIYTWHAFIPPYRSIPTNIRICTYKHLHMYMQTHVYVTHIATIIYRQIYVHTQMYMQIDLYIIMIYIIVTKYTCMYANMCVCYPHCCHHPLMRSNRTAPHCTARRQKCARCTRIRSLPDTWTPSVINIHIYHVSHTHFQIFEKKNRLRVYRAYFHRAAQC